MELAGTGTSTQAHHSRAHSPVAQAGTARPTKPREDIVPVSRELAGPALRRPVERLMEEEVRMYNKWGRLE